MPEEDVLLCSPPLPSLPLVTLVTLCSPPQLLVAAAPAVPEGDMLSRFSVAQLHESLKHVCEPTPRILVQIFICPTMTFYSEINIHKPGQQQQQHLNFLLLSLQMWAMEHRWPLYDELAEMTQTTAGARPGSWLEAEAGSGGNAARAHVKEQLLRFKAKEVGSASAVLQSVACSGFL
eukprot:690953-Pelagomonas_calceolata.AAC.13